MKNKNKLTKLILLFLLTININKGFAQDFYKDYIKYQDARSKPREHLSKSKLHYLHKQFASEFEKLFDEVKRKTGFYMPDRDTLYVFTSQQDYESGSYTKLIWNDSHSCYYENLSFSLFYKYEKKPIEMEIDAQRKLSALGPVLKRIIQNADTLGFRKYIGSSTTPLGAIIQFMVATKVEEHWHFFSSRSFGTRPAD
jgi:hypothetical protein